MKEKSISKKVILFFLGVIAVSIYGYGNFKYNIGIPCILNKIFGIYCSGCGMTRAAIAMAQLDFYQAFRYNAFSMIIIPVIVIAVMSWIFEEEWFEKSIVLRVPSIFWIFLFSVFCAYGIIRNFIPAWQPTALN